MKYSQNGIPQPACGSLPSLSPQHGFGWGREGEEQNTLKKSQTPEVCVVCVCLESHRALSSRGWLSILLESKLWEAGLSQVSRSVTSLHGSFLILGREKETRPRDSEVTLQDPIEKGVLQQLGFPSVVFL